MWGVCWAGQRPPFKPDLFMKLIDVFGQSSNISLVYDFMDVDLEEIIRDRESIVLTASHIKAYMIMILTGLEFLHDHWILHRVNSDRCESRRVRCAYWAPFKDLKPNNLLIDERGTLKLADFGLAKYYGSPDRELTHQVVTRSVLSSNALV